MILTDHGEVLLEYKVWGWKRDEQAGKTWTPIIEPGQVWRNLPSGSNDWREIVEWQ